MIKNKIILILFAITLTSSITAFAVEKALTKKTVSGLAARTNALESQVLILKSQINQMSEASNNRSNSEMYAHGSAVVASPAFLLRGSDLHELFVHLSGINQDLYLLKLRQKLGVYTAEHSFAIPKGPVIALSGGVEGQLIYNVNDRYSKTSRSNVDLSRAELDVIAEAGPWATAAMVVGYDNNDTKSSSGSIAKANNSRLKLDRGWLTFGQLEKFPVYFSVGQLYAPFGDYTSYMVTTPSTQILGRVKDRLAILGYSQYGLYAQIYGAAGETKRASTATNESSWAKIYKHSGINVGYKCEHDEKFNMHIGGGILGNLAESQGMQDNVFGSSSTAESIKSHVLGYNGHVKFGAYDFDLLVEYIGASHAFDQADLIFNDQGAKPQALNIQGAYSSKLFANKLSTLFVGYETTSQALALGLPKQSYFAGYALALLKNVIASIEYRHNVNYNWGDTTGSTALANRSVTGRHNNIVTTQLGVYF